MNSTSYTNCGGWPCYHGECHDGVCRCDSGYSGKFCTQRFCNPSCIHGHCDTNHGTCVCPPGFTGPRCGITEGRPVIGKQFHYDNLACQSDAECVYYSQHAPGCVRPGYTWCKGNNTCHFKPSNNFTSWSSPSCNPTLPPYHGSS